MGVRLTDNELKTEWMVEELGPEYRQKQDFSIRANSSI